VRHGVAYVPGAVFYVGTPEHSRLRLSFAGVSAEQIGEGIRRLAQRIRSARADGKARIAGVR
jgi:2-aminoadipate transaminase